MKIEQMKPIPNRSQPFHAWTWHTKADLTLIEFDYSKPAVCGTKVTKTYQSTSALDCLT